MSDPNRRSPAVEMAGFWALGLLPILYAFLAMFRLPAHYVRLVTEDGIGETATAAMWIGAGVLWARAASGARRDSGPWLVPALFAAGCLFVGLEEISWGQRLLGIRVSWLQSANEQREVNLHNLFMTTHGVERLLVPALVTLYGIVFPIGVRFSTGMRSLARGRNLAVAPLPAVPLYLAAVALFSPLPIMLGQVELAELFLGIAMLLTVAAGTLEEDRRARVRRAALAVAVCLGLALAVVELGPRARTERFVSEGRLMFARGAYLSRGMVEASKTLLEQEASRANDWLGVGTSAGMLAEMAVNDALFEADRGQGPAVPDSWLAKAEGDLVNTTIDLALLSRLQGRDEEARQYLGEAERLINRFDGSGRDDRAMLLARARLLACLGGSAEVPSLLSQGGKRWIGPRRRAFLLDRMRGYERIFRD